MNADAKGWRDLLQDMSELVLENTVRDNNHRLTRYYILKELGEPPEHDPEVVSLRDDLLCKIVDSQMENGSWNNKVYDYEKGTTHQVMTLIDLGMNGKDEPIQKAAAYLVQFQAASGAFVQVSPSCGVEANLIHTTAVVLALARAGYARDLRIIKAGEWLCSWQQKDGRFISPDAQRRTTEGGYPYPYCGLHATCNTLLGLSALDPMQKSHALMRGAHYLFSLYGYKYTIHTDINPPAYFHVPDEPERVPFEGAWYDPRVVPPEAGVIPQHDADRRVEVLTTQHVLETLSVLGYGLENQTVKNGYDRLLNLIAKEDISLSTIMVVKRLHQPFSAFSFHGH
jgi:hypothetical protein